jgi:hypothetical protein
MHIWTHRSQHRPGVDILQVHGRFDLPLNPVCWLLGHRPRVTVVEPGTIKPWRKVECWCGRRWNGNTDKGTIASILERQGKSWADHQAEQVEVARRDPAGVAEGAKGRTGYAERTLELNTELVRRRPARVLEHLGVRLHVGGLGSETPFDAHLDLGAVAAYWSIGGIGHRLAEWLGGGQRRDLSLRVHDGKLWWEVWRDTDHWGAGTPRWRSGHVSIRPFDYLHDGEPKYSYADHGEPRSVTLGMPEGRYDVTFQLQRQVRRRPGGPIMEAKWIASWKSESGIPVRNHEWKGDCIYASAVALPDDIDLINWVPAALGELMVSIMADRDRHDYRPPSQEAG